MNDAERSYEKQQLHMTDSTRMTDRVSFSRDDVKTKLFGTPNNNSASKPNLNKKRARESVSGDEKKSTPGSAKPAAKKPRNSSSSSTSGEALFCPNKPVLRFVCILFRDQALTCRIEMRASCCTFAASVGQCSLRCVHSPNNV